MLLVKNKETSLKDVCQLGSSVFYGIYQQNNSAFNDYINDFITNLKKINQTNRFHDDLSNSQFKVGINYYDDSKFHTVEFYNERYNTDFKVLSVEDEDGLDYANIKTSNESLLDVFCLGFMVCQDDILKKERTKNITRSFASNLVLQSF